MGLEGYTTGYPNNDVVKTVTSDGNWSWYAKSFSMDTGAGDIVIKDENFGGGAADLTQSSSTPVPAPPPRSPSARRPCPTARRPSAAPASARRPS